MKNNLKFNKIDQSIALYSAKNSARFCLIFLGPFLLLLCLDNLLAGALWFCLMIIVFILSVVDDYNKLMTDKIRDDKSGH